MIPYTEAENIPSNAYKMVFIADGCVADIAICNFSSFPYPITLLTDGQENSLSAALEIATWVRSKDMQVKIIHGKSAEMAKQVLSHYHAFIGKRNLKGKRIGVIGTSAPWLIASHADYLLASRRWGVSYIDIPLEAVYNFSIQSRMMKSDWRPHFLQLAPKLAKIPLPKIYSAICVYTKLLKSLSGRASGRAHPF